MLRCILGAVGGIVAGGVFNMAVILLSRVLYPPPAGANMEDMAELGAYIATLPLPAFLIVLVAHAGGALVGGLVAAWIAQRARLALGAVVGGFNLLGGIMAARMIPAPVWFVVVDLLAYLPCGIAGALLAPRRDASATAG
jgi:hypothetical protein